MPPRMSELFSGDFEAERDALTGLPGIAAVRARIEEWNGQARGTGDALTV